MPTTTANRRTGPARIVVLGSINQDITVTATRLPGPGETITGTSISHTLGGKGANQAVAAARAGAQVTMIAGVGADDAAAALLVELAATGVDTSRVRRMSQPTGTAVITVDTAAENTIVVVPGANGALQTLEADDLATIADADLLVLQLELPLPVVIAGAAAAATAGVPVLLNPSPARDMPPELLSHVLILVLNEGEAAALGPDALGAVPHVVTTLGARGASYLGPEGAFSVPAPVVAALDTTGAGDAFTGALAAAWSTGDSPLSAVRRGCVAGALAATRPGASTSAPTRAAIDALTARTYR